VTATIMTTITLNGIDEAGSSLGVVELVFASGTFFSEGDCTTGWGFKDAASLLALAVLS
jgi:hypothetical protein